MPLATGIPKSSAIWEQPLALSALTYSKCGVPPRITAPRAMIASSCFCSGNLLHRQRDLNRTRYPHDTDIGFVDTVTLQGINGTFDQALNHKGIEAADHDGVTAILGVGEITFYCLNCHLSFPFYGNL